MNNFEQLLKGGDLRSIGKSDDMVDLVTNQQSFDSLFSCLTLPDRIVVMRAADVIEKISVEHKEYLVSHKKELLQLLNVAKEKELQWHLALIIPRIKLSGEELKQVWKLLTKWALDGKQSRIVRVNALQGLYELSSHSSKLRNSFYETITTLQKVDIPSIAARIKKIKNIAGNHS